MPGVERWADARQTSADPCAARAATWQAHHDGTRGYPDRRASDQSQRTREAHMLREDKVLVAPGIARFVAVRHERQSKQISCRATMRDVPADA
jgi:hypothetical protein